LFIRVIYSSFTSKCQAFAVGAAKLQMGQPK